MFTITLFICPLLIIGVWSYDWDRKRRYLKRILNQHPFSEIDKIGFCKKTLITNHNSLKDYVRFAEIDGIQILLNVDIKNANIAEFTTYCNTFNLTNQQFSQKFEELKHKNIELGFYSLTKKINIRKEKLSIQNLQVALSNLSTIVKINNFEPILIEDWENV